MAVLMAAQQAADRFGLDPQRLRRLGGNSGSAWGINGLVMRVGRAEVIKREAVASSAAAAFLPVARVINQVEFDGLAALLLETLPGRPVGDWVQRHPKNAHKVGLACGNLHRLLAKVAAPPALRAVPEAPPPALSDNARRTVHLDLHPYNVLVDDDGAVTGVLDWANAAGGNPDLDRARTWTILNLDPSAPLRRAVPGWSSLVKGWSEAGELLELSATARAWACRFMLADLAPRYSAAALSQVSDALLRSAHAG